ncbi:DNA-binding protein [Blautia producta]|uniref:DNA-binding protein n=1 Tax=Blautia producta TaxID=33035 RepID=UPI0031B64ADC
MNTYRKDRKYYRKYFKDYPEVVDLIRFRQMIGGICDNTARRIMREGKVKHFFIRNTYKIPKECVIDYVLSEHYAEDKCKFRVSI